MKKAKIHSSIILKSFIASADQAILSALSFIISIVLIKTVSKVDYGYYAIGFSIALFLISIQNAIVNTPLAVLLVSKTGNTKKKYTASLFYGQFIVILPAVCIGILAAAMAFIMGFDSTQTSVAAAISFSSIGILFREFIRAYFYAEELPQKAFKLDLLYVSLFLGSIGSSYFFFNVGVAFIFILMGTSGGLAALLYSRSRDWKYDKTAIKQSYKENWKYGKWALLGVVVWHIQNHGYLYLLGALIGSIAVADVSAARLLMMPLFLARVGWMKIAIPHGSRLREKNQLDRFFKELVFVSIIFALIVGLYVIILFLFSEMLQTYVLTEKYAASFGYLILWAVIFTVGFASGNASYGLQVIKRFDLISKLNMVTMLVTLGCSYIGILNYGIKGALMALIIGLVIEVVILWYFFAKAVFLLSGDKLRYGQIESSIPEFKK
jgi:O-antigen/teichoic acid export membrane protein